MNDKAENTGTPAAAEPPANAPAEGAAGQAGDKPDATPEARAQQGRASRGGSGPALALSGLALLVALGLGGAGYYLWDSFSRLHAAQESALSAMQAQVARLAQQSTELAAALQQSVEQARAERERLSATLDSLAAGQQAIEAALAEARTTSTTDPTEWVLAEVRYLLYLANQRLQLARDVPAALAALAAADGRLRQLADPSLLPIRQQIAGEREALRAAPVPDVEGIDASLASLIARVDGLPVAGVQPPAGPEGAATRADGPGDEGLGATGERIWRELQRLVVVRRQDGGAVPLLAPEEAYFLHRNLELQLEAARLGLLRGSSGLYRRSLEQARDWLGRHFNQQDAGVQAMSAEIDRLIGVQVAPSLPDISGSLALVRKRLALGEADGGGS